MMGESEAKAPWGVLWLDDKLGSVSQREAWTDDAGIRLARVRTIEGFVDVLGRWWLEGIQPAVVVLDIDLSEPTEADVQEGWGQEWLEEWASKRKYGKPSLFRWTDDVNALNYVRSVAPGLELLLFGPPPSPADGEAVRARAKRLVDAVTKSVVPVSEQIKETMREKKWVDRAHEEDIASVLEPQEFAQVVRAALAYFRGGSWAWPLPEDGGNRGETAHGAQQQGLDGTKRSNLFATRGGDFAAALLVALACGRRPKVLGVSAVWPTGGLAVGNHVLDVQAVEKTISEGVVRTRLADWFRDALEGPPRVRASLEDLVLELRRFVAALPDNPVARGRFLARELRNPRNPVHARLKALGWLSSEEGSEVQAIVGPAWHCGEPLSVVQVDSRRLGRALAYEVIDAALDRASGGIDANVVKEATDRIARVAPPSALRRLRDFCGYDPERSDQLFGLAHFGASATLDDKRAECVGAGGKWPMALAAEAVETLLPWAPHAARLVRALYRAWPERDRGGVLEAASSRKPQGPEAFGRLLNVLGLDRDLVRRALHVPLPASWRLDVGPGTWLEAPFGLDPKAVGNVGRQGDDERWDLYEHWLLRAIAGVYKKGVLGRHLGRAAALVFGRELVERLRLNADVVAEYRSLVEPPIESAPQESGTWDPGSLLGRWVRWRGLDDWVHVDPSSIAERRLVDALALLEWLERCWGFLVDAPVREGAARHVRVSWFQEASASAPLYVVSVGPQVRGRGPHDGDVGAELRELLEALPESDGATAARGRLLHLGARAVWLPDAGPAPVVLHDQPPVQEKVSWANGGWDVPHEVLGSLFEGREMGEEGRREPGGRPREGTALAGGGEVEQESGRLVVIVGLPADEPT